MYLFLRRVTPRRLVRFLKRLRSKILQDILGFSYASDGMYARGKNTAFLNDQNFSSSWENAVAHNKAGWSNDVPDIRWRAHIALWAAEHCKELEGDFVECGVHTGILSHSICKYINFSNLDKKFFLFDTFEGIPSEKLSESEKANSEYFNNNVYFDCYDIVKKSFAAYPNVHLVKGLIPDSLSTAQIDKVAFISIDLNNAYAERKAIEYFWGKLVSGGIVVLDDYGCTTYKLQKETIDEFLSFHDTKVVTLPTGQGLAIKR